jgi:hypothetical protein
MEDIPTHTWVTENGTIRKSCAVGFSSPLSYFYEVLETGEKFSSKYSDIRRAYKQWITYKEKNNIPMKMVVD